ncbi:MAG: amidohydrolase [Lachnospiraceae bacterium]|nr:amidohydrolase [Lachnospiraceae bacterium]
MKYRFYNARILTMDPLCEEGDTSVFRGEVHTEDGKVTYVGENCAGAAAGEFDREIDCEGNLLMPGFKDAHTHSAMTFLRSNADDLPLQEWLNEQVFPYEAKLTGSDIEILTRLAILEYYTSGITSIMEMYLDPPAIARACIDMGMRVVQVGGVNNFSQSPELLEEWYRTLNDIHPLSSFAMGFHAEYTCSRELLERFAALAAKYKAPFFAHISETEREVSECVERYGRTPVEFLCSLGIFDYGGAGYHLVHTTQDDIAIMKEKGIGAVTNPGSNTKLASGIAPVQAYLDSGLKVAIGTDGPASNNCLDMFREMFLTAGLGKLLTKDASAVPAENVLRMACSDGADIMLLPDCNCLRAGKKADMIMIDLDQPNMQPINNIACNLVYSGSKANVKMTMIDGRIVYDRFEGTARFDIPFETEEIYRTAQEVRDRILG